MALNSLISAVRWHHAIQHCNGSCSPFALAWYRDIEVDQSEVICVEADPGEKTLL